MLNNFISLIQSFLPLFSYVLNSIFLFMFIVTIPCVIRNLICWRK